MKEPTKEYHSLPVIRDIVDASFAVYKALGPYLVEHAYQIALKYELQKRGYKVETEKWIHIQYHGETIENAFRVDLLVDDSVIVELKAVPALEDRHKDQLQSYMMISGIPYGILINFHADILIKQMERYSLEQVKFYAQIK